MGTDVYAANNAQSVIDEAQRLQKMQQPSNIENQALYQFNQLSWSNFCATYKADVRPGGPLIRAVCE